MGRRWDASVDGPLHPATDATWQVNENLLNRLRRLNQDRDALELKLSNVDQEQHFLADDLASIRSKLSEFGLTPTIGLLLRHRKEQLDGPYLYDDHIRHARERMAVAQSDQLELDYAARPIADVPGEADQRVAEAGLMIAPADVPRVRYQFTRLLDHRNALLEQLKYGYRDYATRLDDLDTAAAASKATVAEYRALIGKNVTWIRSGHTLTWANFRECFAGLAALFDSRRTAAFGDALGNKLTDHSLVAFGGLVVALVLVIVRWRLKKSITDRGRARNRDSSLPRQVAVVGLMTLTLAAIVPGALFAVSGFLRWDHETSESLINASVAMGSAAMVLLLIEIPRQASRSMGLIDKQVLASLPTRQSLFRMLTALAVVLPVLAYFMTLTRIIDHGMWRDSLARFCFLAFVTIMAFTGHILMRPKRGLMKPVLKATHNGWAHRMRHVLYVLSVGFPIVLIFLSVSGYGYTANELLDRCIDTVIFLAATWVVAKIGGQVVQWVWSRFEPEGADSDSPGVRSGGDMVGKLTRRFSDAKQRALQSHLAFLGRCGVAAAILGGLLMLWIEIVPSLQAANPTVWTIHETQHQMVMDIAGEPTWEPTVVATDITVANIGLALATLFFTIQIAKTLPLMVDVLVLDHLFRDEAMKRMLVACGRGLIFLIGGVTASQWVGLRWDMIQWIVAAAAIGMGFGAQDMVKNLLGGLVVLYERPAKTGDRITIGKMTGRVTAQRLRTTVLADDEGREMIVPNKKFVSDDVVNWSDTVKGRRAA